MKYFDQRISYDDQYVVTNSALEEAIKTEE